VKLVVGDGSHGLREFAPYDAILVSAAAPSIPRSLFDQLAEDGRMVIPVGPQHSQELQLVRKRAGQPVINVIEGCRFVPLIGAEGY
jgi:protein-L-isoaspartate(D-aspartate) O-methyltransferase